MYFVALKKFPSDATYTNGPATLVSGIWKSHLDPNLVNTVVSIKDLCRAPLLSCKIYELFA